MRFLIGKSIYEVEITGLDSEERYAWIDGLKLMIVRDQPANVAAAKLIDTCAVAWLAERGGIGNDHPFITLAERIGAERARDVIDGFERQFTFAGGEPKLAEMMGLVVEPVDKPKIDWGKLDGKELADAVIRWRLCGHLSTEVFGDYKARYTALGLNPLAEDCVPDVEFDGKNCRHVVKVIVTLKAKLRIAARTGTFGGFVETKFVDEAGELHDVWIGPKPRRRRSPQCCAPTPVNASPRRPTGIRTRSTSATAKRSRRGGNAWVRSC